MEPINAKGASGAIYTYQALPSPITLRNVPTNYMFASRRLGGWEIYYIGQCNSAKNQIPTDQRWAEAVKLGATHILSHLGSPNAVVREIEERDLIESHNPPLNVQHRTTGNLLLARGRR